LIDFSAIKLESNEGPEDLYQRLMAFVEDNLLRRDYGITHGGEPIAEDEELSPTIENFVVLTWQWCDGKHDKGSLCQQTGP